MRTIAIRFELEEAGMSPTIYPANSDKRIAVVDYSLLSDGSFQDSEAVLDIVDMAVSMRDAEIESNGTQELVRMFDEEGRTLLALIDTRK
jgi:hypothetical protein